ncbi:Protein CBG22447 [Caenorhabditis briggsae]|uniref:Uncharacterized protein n=2 Tax=Caenorhabditis briggsae TaxID=6238 RepID=A0AAE9A1N6_CAEBR|nr:Protein CBG22447 [Caenorhabditis briggsae]ULT86900.1 hypothetical protein L3Y34_006556 [Caenorhabditis briggsae]CAP39033.2 Protein CBG22447 [Caenorhabditis briggsae]
MRFPRKILWISTIRKFPTVAFQNPPPESTIIDCSQVFDPEKWLSIPEDSNPTSSELNFEFLTTSSEPLESPESTSSSDVIENEKKKTSEASEGAEENRADGHAPIKWALSVLMQSLQRSSKMTTSLSDIDVTLFNFHSTRFAERLLNRNVSSVVMVESSHVFSKNAKKFASKHPNVSAYRADIYTLMGVGRKKTAQFPTKLMFADYQKEAPEGLRPWTLESSESDEQRLRRPHLLAVLPTVTIQKTIVDSLIQHALLHHSGLDTNTVFRFGETNLMTFLSAGILSQFICSSDDRLGFLSHQHRRHSALFQRLFDLKILGSADPPCGFKSTSFHPQLPASKKVTHEKKLGELNLNISLQYPVQISPKRHVAIGGTSISGMGRILVDYACFLTQIGRQPNAKNVEQVVRTLWPESSVPSDLLEDHKIGQLPLDHLESIFYHIQEELSTTQIAHSYCNELKIKRVV